MNENEVLNLDEEIPIIELEDENGEKVEFELLDVLEYRGKEYIVVLPTDDDSTVIIMEIEPIDEESERYLPVPDEAIVEAVYELFKEKNKDLYDFE
ncbi:MAG: DUF1292 domain-containing protein [Oscillospiraceae bacterium]|nr:DUF1292 domain-containing protein [Oscillospiraceae bacterium]